MKKTLVILAVLMFAFASLVYAQMGMMGSQSGQMGQGMKMEEGQQMQMMQCPKMQMMHGQGMMAGTQMQMTHCQDMMQMMTDVLNMQEKIVSGIKPEEKDKMLQDLKQMKEKLQDMAGTCKCMMGQQPPQTPPPAAPAPSEHKH